MTIAVFLRRFPALSETFVLNQITGLLDRGHSVEIFAESPRDEVSHPDVAKYELLKRTHYWAAAPGDKWLRFVKGAKLLASDILRRPVVASHCANVFAYGRESLTMNLARAAWALRDRRHFDIVHCHFGNNAIVGMALRDMGLLRGTLIASFYGFDLSASLRTDAARVYCRLFGRGDLFLPLSERFRDRLLHLGCPASKIELHRIGINPATFHFRPRPDTPPGMLRVVSIARLVEKKGVGYAIRAIADLLAKGHRVTYTVIGDGPLRHSLSQLAANLGIADSVHLVGAKAQPEIIRTLVGADMFVLPSVVAADGDEEGTPVVLMEAMAMGVPVVATRHGSIPEVVEDGVSGLLVPERDVAALASAMTEIARDRARASKLAHAARQRIVAQHNIDVLNDSLVELYHRVGPRPPDSHN